MKENIGVDLHIHTTNSDGEKTVDEILQMAEEAGLKIVGIVDHDTIKQFEGVKKSQEAKRLQNAGVKIWVGTEFSSIIDGYKLHIIGYNFNEKSQSIKELISELEGLRRQKLEDRLMELDERGIGLKEEQKEWLRSIKNVGKPHIAKCLLENGVGNSIGEIISTYLMGKRPYRLDAKKVIDFVHGAGGIVVIAHPYQIAEENKVGEKEAEKVWEKLVNLGADGMECFYNKYNETKISYLLKFAKKHKLLVTAGSDYHGPVVKPKVKLGVVKS